MARVFISYSRQDQIFVRRLATDLQSFGAHIWLDVDNIPAGMKWSSAIQEGLDKSEIMIVVISAYSMSSKNVEDEWQYFRDHNKPIVPVYLSTARMHFQLSRLQYIDFRTTPYAAAFSELYNELTKLGMDLHPFSADRLAQTIITEQSTSLAVSPLANPNPPNKPKENNGVSRLTFGALAILLVIGGILIGSGVFNNFAKSGAQNIVLNVTVSPEATDEATQSPTVEIVEATPTTPATDTPVITNTSEPSTLSAGSIRTDNTGITQVWVPAGCFTMGAEPTEQIAASDDEGPVHEVCLTKGYWIDRYEVSNADYQKFVEAGGYEHDEYWSVQGLAWRKALKRIAPSDFSGFTDAQQPRVGISWYEAEAYAKWRGGSLPTEAQWEYAARGPDALVYPWGNDWDQTKSNNRFTGTNRTTIVDSYPDSASWIGAFNMAGNVREWTADWYDKSYYRLLVKNDPPGGVSGITRVTKGGAWTSDKDIIQTRDDSRASFRYDIMPDKFVNTVGIRVVSPSTE